MSEQEKNNESMLQGGPLDGKYHEVDEELKDIRILGGGGVYHYQKKKLGMVVSSSLGNYEVVFYIWVYMGEEK